MKQVLVFLRYKKNLGTTDFINYVINGSRVFWGCTKTFTALEKMSLLDYQKLRIDCIRHDLAFIKEVQLIKPKK